MIEGVVDRIVIEGVVERIVIAGVIEGVVERIMKGLGRIIRPWP
jgi:hypothetical protein